MSHSSSNTRHHRQMEQTVCQDHHVCRNGSVCVEHPEFPGAYTCDCTASTTNGVYYAGLSCDHAATSFCNSENSPNGASFCTNNGVCVSNVDALGTHTACNCPSGYTGDFCELVDGQSVPDHFKMSAMRSRGSSGGGSSSANTVLVVSLATAAAALLVAIFAIVYVVKKRRNGESHSTRSPKSIRHADSSQLELDPDGQVLQASIKFSVSKDGSLHSPSSTRQTASMDSAEDAVVEIDQEGV